jgi:hypothetical protein
MIETYIRASSGFELLIDIFTSDEGFSTFANWFVTFLSSIALRELSNIELNDYRQDVIETYLSRFELLIDIFTSNEGFSTCNWFGSFLYCIALRELSNIELNDYRQDVIETYLSRFELLIDIFTSDEGFSTWFVTFLSSIALRELSNIELNDYRQDVIETYLSRFELLIDIFTSDEGFSACNWFGSFLSSIALRELLNIELNDHRQDR